MSYPISRTSYNNDVGCGGSGEKSGGSHIPYFQEGGGKSFTAL